MMPESGDAVGSSRGRWLRTRRASWRLTACALVAGCATAPPEAGRDRIYRGISLSEMQGEMQQMGLRAERQSEDGTSWLESGTSGYRFLVFFYDCDTVGVCEDIQLRAWFANEASFALEDINRWNSQKRFGKLYMDEEGDLAIEMDLPAKGGITPDEVRYALDLWDLILNEFAAAAFSEASQEDAPGASP